MPLYPSIPCLTPSNVLPFYVTAETRSVECPGFAALSTLLVHLLFGPFKKPLNLFKSVWTWVKKKSVIKSHFLATQKIFGSDQNNLILVQIYKT